MNAGGGGRLAALDVLRGIAILLVLGRHMPAWPADSSPAWLRPLADAWQRAGWIGVDLFFVLSGYLVSGLLFREWQKHGDLRPVRFLVRRGFKIYPGYYALVGGWVAIMFIVGNIPAWQHVVSQALFLQNYWEILLSHTWSLAVEEHFYLILPFLLLAVRGKGNSAVPFPAIPWICAAALVACVAFRLATPWPGRLVWSTHVFPTHLRIDGLFLGVWLSWLHFYKAAPLAAFIARWRLPMLLAAVALALPPFFLHIETERWLSTIGFSFLSASAAIWLLLALDRPAPARRGPLAWIGFHSYSIYLWHVPMSTLGMKYLAIPSAPHLLNLAIYLVGSILLGWLAALVIELPFLKLRDRLFPSRSDPAPL